MPPRSSMAVGVVAMLFPAVAVAAAPAKGECTITSFDESAGCLGRSPGRSRVEEAGWWLGDADASSLSQLRATLPAVQACHEAAIRRRAVADWVTLEVEFDLDAQRRPTNLEARFSDRADGELGRCVRKPFGGVKLRREEDASTEHPRLTYMIKLTLAPSPTRDAPVREPTKDAGTPASPPSPSKR
jgi:hypothetical protein